MSPERGWRRWRTPVGIGVAVVALAVAAAFANVALLGSAGEDRLGHLRPVSAQAPATTAPALTPDDGTQPGGATTDGDDHGGTPTDTQGSDRDDDD